MRDRARSSHSNADSFLSCVCVIIEISSGVGNRCDPLMLYCVPQGFLHPGDHMHEEPNGPLSNCNLVFYAMPTIAVVSGPLSHLWLLNSDVCGVQIEHSGRPKVIDSFLLLFFEQLKHSSDAVVADRGYC